MLRTLQTIHGVNVDAQCTVAADLKRGTFVAKNELTKSLSAAADLAACTGVLVRDFNVNEVTAVGTYPVSEYDDSQDLVKSGEYAGHRVMHKGERFATSEYAAGLTDAQAQAGKYLTVATGKLATSGTATVIMSLGWIMDAGMHKLLGFQIV